MSSEKEISEKDAISAALRVLVEEYNLTRREIAEALKVDVSTVTSWVNGRHAPGRDEVLHFEDMLQLRRGTVERMAGYVEDAVTLEEMIEQSVTLGEVHKRTLRSVLESLEHDTRASRERDGRNA